MRETTFIKQKKKSWKKFEQLQKKSKADPDKLTQLFVEITDDLSYSRTFYSKRSVRVYLNYLSQLVFLKVNKNKKINVSKFIRFWTHSLPLEFARSWKAMVLALFVFTGSMVIGILSTANDIDYARQIMGRSYINRTDDNIANGDPMAIYHQGAGAAWSTFGLTANNTMVAARTYTSGIIAGLPSIIIMVKNGIMLGTFHYYLYHKGVLEESMWIIWIHGVLEISAIVLAGGAGLVLGGGLLFPGTYTRLQSLRISAKRSFKIALSTLFILVISGFIEGSITRFTDMPMGLKYLIVLGSLAFICFYFIAYPIYLYVNKIKPGKFFFKDDIPHVKKKTIQLDKVRELGDMFNDTLNLYRQLFQDVIKGWLVSGIPIVFGVIIHHFFTETAYDEELFWWVNLKKVIGSTTIGLGYLTVLTLPIFMSVFYALTIYRDKQKFNVLAYFKFFLLGLLKLWPLYLVVGLFFIVPSGLTIFLTIVLSPFIFLFSYAGFYSSDQGYFKALQSASKLITKSWFGSIGFFLLQLVIPILLFVAMYYLFGSKGLGGLDIMFQFILEHIAPFVDNLNPYGNGLNFLVYYIFYFAILSFATFGLVIQFHSVRERIQGITLYNRLKSFGAKHNLFEQIDEGEY